MSALQSSHYDTLNSLEEPAHASVSDATTEASKSELVETARAFLLHLQNAGVIGPKTDTSLPTGPARQEDMAPTAEPFDDPRDSRAFNPQPATAGADMAETRRKLDEIARSIRAIETELGPSTSIADKTAAIDHEHASIPAAMPPDNAAGYGGRATASPAPLRTADHRHFSASGRFDEIDPSGYGPGYKDETDQSAFTAVLSEFEGLLAEIDEHRNLAITSGEKSADQQPHQRSSAAPASNRRQAPHGEVDTDAVLPLVKPILPDDPLDAEPASPYDADARVALPRHRHEADTHGNVTDDTPRKPSDHATINLTLSKEALRGIAAVLERHLSALSYTPAASRRPLPLPQGRRRRQERAWTMPAAKSEDITHDLKELDRRLGELSQRMRAAVMRAGSAMAPPDTLARNDLPQSDSERMLQTISEIEQHQRKLAMGESAQTPSDERFAVLDYQVPVRHYSSQPYAYSPPAFAPPAVKTQAVRPAAQSGKARAERRIIRRPLNPQNVSHSSSL